MTACQAGGGGEQMTADTTDYVYNYMKIREKIRDEEGKAEGIREQRVSRGDTVALEPEQLKAFLPKTFDGFTREGDLVGTPYQLSGVSFSNAEQNYVKGSTHIRITLCDFNGKESRFAQETAYFASGMRIDNRKVIAGSILLADTYKGWEIYDKRTQKAELSLALSDRILLKFIANQQKDTEYLKSIAQQMNLKELARL